jgi:hypothetical protein
MTRRPEEPRPAPVPQIGAGCPPGYSASPTVRHVRAVERHAVQGLSVDGRLPYGMDLFSDVADVRRNQLQMTRHRRFQNGTAGGGYHTPPRESRAAPRFGCSLLPPKNRPFEPAVS